MVFEKIQALTTAYMLFCNEELTETTLTTPWAELFFFSLFFFKINRSAKWEEAVDSNSAAVGDRQSYNNIDVD